MIEKNFKNLDEQVEIFKFKGMIINDEKYVKKVLLRENMMKDIQRKQKIDH